MAGGEEYFEVTKEINKWFLDYLRLVTWEDFRESNHVTIGERDLIQGMLYMMGNEGVREETQLFLVMLCRLTDGEDCDINYSESSNITVLEDMLIRFETLIKMQTKELMAEGEVLVPVIKSQAVMVCCRADEFELAQEVCNRLWPKKDRKDKVYESMQELLRQKSTDSVFLEDYSYDDFLKTMVKYLGKIQEHFTSPLVYEAAKNVLKHKNDDRDTQGMDMDVEEENQSSNATTTQAVSCAVLQTSVEKKGRKLRSPTRQLRKLWTNNTSQLFGVPSSPAKQNEKTPNKEAVQEQEKAETHKRTMQGVFQYAGGINSPDSQTVSKTSKEPVKQSRTAGDDFLAPAEPRRTNRTAKRNASDDNFQTPADPGPSQTSTPDKKTTHSPAKYRKNIDREDRHKPLDKSSGSDVSDDDDISICTTMTTGGHKKVMWSQEEMEEFYDAVQIFGVGKWAEIRDHLSTSRSSVKLKDKWRTMTRRGDIEEIQKKRNKKSPLPKKKR